MKEYIYDGSFEGFLTSIFHAYKDKDTPVITRVSLYRPSLFTEPVWVLTRKDLFERVCLGIEKKLSAKVLKKLYYGYLSEVEGAETTLLTYLKLCYQYGEKINLAKNNDTICAMDTLYRKVRLEKHRFLGFVRFNEIGPHKFYAKIEPDHHILPLLESHFVKRFGDQSFIIHDVTRSIALVYTQKESFFQVLSREQNETLKGITIQDDYTDLFKTFYHSVTIQNRLNPRLQKTFMPIRYWKNMNETEG